MTGIKSGMRRILSYIPRWWFYRCVYQIIYMYKGHEEGMIYLNKIVDKEEERANK